MRNLVIFLLACCISFGMTDESEQKAVYQFINGAGGEVFEPECDSSDGHLVVGEKIFEGLGGNQEDTFSAEAYPRIKRRKLLPVILPCKYTENIGLYIQLFGTLENPPSPGFVSSRLTQCDAIDKTIAKYPNAVGLRVLIEEYEHPQETFFLINAEPPQEDRALDSWFMDNIENIVLCVKISADRDDVPMPIMHLMIEGVNCFGIPAAKLTPRSLSNFFDHT